MNKPFFTSAAVVFAAAAVLVAQQSSRLEEVRRSTLAASSSAAAPAAASRTWTPPPAKRPEPEGRLLDRLGERLVASLEISQIAQFLEAADGVELGRIAIAAALTEQERTAFAEKFAAFRSEQAALMKQKDASDIAWKSLTDQKNAWIAGQLGAERLAKVEEAKKVAARAGAEHDAARLVSRISSAADLTTEQKDRLYAAFVDRAQSRPPAPARGDPALKFRLSSSLTEEPPVPGISEEARAILTPDQWAVHEQSRTIIARQMEVTQNAMMAMAPAAIATLQELLDETTPKQ